jgi:alkaline phosphatase D
MANMNNSISRSGGAVLSRRKFISRSGRAAAFTALGFAAAPAILKGKPRGFAFQHGVASGDPLPDGAIIWTRVTPSPEALPGMGLGGSAEVRWEVSLDPNFSTKVARGVVITSAALDHTVKVDVRGLAAGRTHFFRFLFRNEISRVGRFRTAPPESFAAPNLRFGLASCSNYEGGYFAAYRHMAARNDLDFILHIGDYIYEYETGGYGPGPTIGRVHDPLTEIVTLQDYRRRHALYKLDPDLQELHAAYAFICTWDDHDLTNDAWRAGAENHQPETEGDFFTRQANAYKAYFEWMPIRLPDPATAPTRIYRQFKFGQLADLSMLDLRQYRDEQPTSGLDPAKDDPNRVIVGRDQLDWLENHIDSAARWKLIGNPVMVTPVDFRQPLPEGILEELGLMMGVPFNVDAWDGYTDDRRELLEFIGANGISNVAFLTGDIHSSWGCDVPAASGVSAAVEFVGPSITSDNLNEALGIPPRTPVSIQTETVFKAGNPHVKYLEFDSHGYAIVDITVERMQTDWYFLTERTDRNSGVHFADAFLSAAGSNMVQPAGGALGPRI